LHSLRMASSQFCAQLFPGHGLGSI
jgi:hypothetical protein